ncbi:BlaI/MecI/CopY family transcriptional regulator [Pseudomarimonas salicorniae]|uniref:BlaI/MecI/CopY family transcriptional regulator n=1 Tax=Pseudomarimonas salicorniae TaxID=2933270 RepID=A0ABT0GDH6_9GAMM|nr:BlaI/MecI/CopY family transcriptional regulator [Lysobacter sp. CAU 1642]MCK7592092.1 BlaI/MecI/CopY family transcriptional regulator [Lysobacter sp. CAU 1642]
MQRPSNAELELLKCLWREGTLSARELHDLAEPALGWSYSSTRKTLERMRDKGLVSERPRHGLNLYRAAVSKLATLAALSEDFARRVLELDGPLPVQAFAESRLLSEDEMGELEALLRKPEGAAEDEA